MKYFKFVFVFFFSGLVFFFSAENVWADFVYYSGGQFTETQKVVKFVQNYYANIFNEQTIVSGEKIKSYLDGECSIFTQKFLDLPFEDAKKIVFEKDISFSKAVDFRTKNYESHSDIGLCFFYECIAKNYLLTRTKSAKEMAEIIASVAMKFEGKERRLKYSKDFNNWLVKKSCIVKDEDAREFCEYLIKNDEQFYFYNFIFNNKNVARFIDVLAEECRLSRTLSMVRKLSRAREALKIYRSSGLEKHVGKLSDYYRHLINFKEAFLSEDPKKIKKMREFLGIIRYVENEKPNAQEPQRIFYIFTAKKRENWERFIATGEFDLDEEYQIFNLFPQERAFLQQLLDLLNAQLGLQITIGECQLLPFEKAEAADKIVANFLKSKNNDGNKVFLSLSHLQKIFRIAQKEKTPIIFDL